MSAGDRRNIRKLRKYSGRLNRMLEDGSFQSLPSGRRSKLVRRLQRLCRSLVGAVSEVGLRHILAGAAVLVLGIAGCGDNGGGPGPDTSADTDAEVDVADILDPDADPDVSDLDDGADTDDDTGVPDVDDATDAPDIDDVTEVSDAADADDGMDADDVTDATDAPDADDGMDVDDVTEVSDAADADDGSDASDGSDADADVTPVTPAFATAVSSPFGFTPPVTTYYVTPALADIDGDGDIDLFMGEISYYGGTLHYYQNTGTATSPAFAAPTADPFGLTGVGPIPAGFFADMDDDGDFDMMLGRTNLSYTPNTTMLYYQNTGSATAPAFAAPVTDPFGLSTVSSFFVFPVLADMDDDGDFDLVGGLYYGDWSFWRNTGSTSTPAFGSPSSNPFGLTATDYINEPAVSDIDMDGDLDLFSGERNGDIVFFENTGTATLPAFATVSENPFGLARVASYYAFPAFADIDGDGDDDLFVGEYGGALTYFENTTF